MSLYRYIGLRIVFQTPTPITLSVTPSSHTARAISLLLQLMLIDDDDDDGAAAWKSTGVRLSVTWRVAVHIRFTSSDTLRLDAAY